MFASATPGFFGNADSVVAPLPGGWALSFDNVLALASWRFNGDGTVDRVSDGSSSSAHRWHTSSTPGTYYVRATKLSGITPGGDALATWINATSAPAWTLTATPNDVKECQLLIEISSTADVADVVTSGTYRITADANLL